MGNENSSRRKAGGKAPGPSSPRNNPGSGTTNQVMNATQKMRTTIDNLNKRRALLELKAKKARKEAFEYKKGGSKKQALLALKRSKMFEDEVNKVDSQLFNLERQQIHLEAGSTSLDVVSAVGAGLRAQRQIAANMNPDTVAEQVDQQQELIENQQEVQEILGQGSYDEVNDAELLAELEDLEADDVEQRVFGDKVKEKPKDSERVDFLPAAPKGTVVTLPTAPKEQPVAVNNDADALAELEAEML